MVSSRLLFFLSLCVKHYFTPTIAKLELQYRDCYVRDGNYTNNSPYEENLNHLLNSTTNITSINYGFYNSSYGEDPDAVHASALCRPDMEPDSCADCINVAKQNLPTLCPKSRLAIGGYDDRGFNNCMFRYADYNTIGVMQNAPYFFVNANRTIMDNVEEFNRTRKSLLDQLIKTAASNSPNKYATGEEPVTNVVTIYALVQCTPDITATDCQKCLSSAITLMPNCCDTQIGGRVITPSCNFRYETSKFYKTSIEVPPISSPPPSTNPTNTKGKKNYTVIIIVVVSAVTFVILLTVGICIFLRRRKSEEKYGNEDEITDAEPFQFKFHTIKIATDEFSDANKLGQGGFGAVYKGMLSDGQQVAVKRLALNSKQGEGEFKNEVQLLAKLQHRNLVRLLGFCLEREERILVYEFVPNSSLNHFIFGPNRKHMNWERRYKIIVGIARGLLYLHEDSRLKIIHRDLKADNILLDSEMNPKISDFGMARLFQMNQSQSNTNQIAGTFGYMAPEYVNHGRLSVKSDVYSFGILIIEIVTGQKRSTFRGEEETEELLAFTWKSWREGSTLNLIDPTLSGGSTVEMTKCIHIGLLCVQETESDRPTMAQVIFMLNSEFLNVPAPSKPGFFLQSSVNQPRNEIVLHSQNEASITELSPR